MLLVKFHSAIIFHSSLAIQVYYSIYNEHLPTTENTKYNIKTIKHICSQRKDYREIEFMEFVLIEYSRLYEHK